MAKKKPRKSAFVPKLLVPAAAAVTVVPAVAVASCGGPDTQNTTWIGVAAVAYPAYEAGAGGASGDASDDASDAPVDAPIDVVGA